MTTYEDIRKANESIRTTNIKGKEYAEVNQRIKAFRMVYPTGYIRTTMLSNENGVCVFRAEVGYTESDKINQLGVGHAYEKESSSFINKTSYIENCETSAVGRALGMAGFGIDTSVASAEEVETAILNQQANEKIDDVKVRSIVRRCDEAGIAFDKILKLYKVANLSDLTMRQFNNLHENWDKVVKA